MTAAEFVEGAAGLLDAAGVGVYDTTRTWTDADTAVAVVIGELPQTPTKCVALEFYTVRDDPKLTDSTVALQIRCRGDESRTSVLALDAAVFGALHGLHDTSVNGVPVTLMWRQNLMPMSTDENQRCRSTANYYAYIAQPSTYRED